LSIAYGNLCVISAIIADLPVRHQRARRSPQVSRAGMDVLGWNSAATALGGSGAGGLTGMT
jgi:hypothetical protein